MIATLLWELRQRRTTIMWWTIASVILAVVIMALYPSIRDQAKQLNQVINQLPQGIRELKTGGSTSLDVANPIQFLNSQLFYATLPIIWIILAITRGGSVLGRDEEAHTLELTLARPISRTRLVASKALSLVCEFIVIGGITLLVIVIGAPLFGLHVGTTGLILATAYTAAFSLSFGLIALALSATNLARRSASFVAVFVSFGGYLIASLSGMTSWLKIPAKFAPFHYFAPDKIMHGQSVLGLNIYLIGALVVTTTVAYLGFRHRDIS